MRFRKAPSRRLAPPRLVPRTPRPWDPPETELPGIVPINTLLVDRSERTAIAITGIWAYTRGFEFFVTRIIRPGTPGWDEDPVPDAPGDRFAAPSFQISLQLADGRKVIGGRPYGDSEPAGPILRLRGGGGSSHYQSHRWWAWPLPPSGPLEFICPGPTPEISETRVSIDAEQILDAARRSIQLWPEDET